MLCPRRRPAATDSFLKRKCSVVYRPPGRAVTPFAFALAGGRRVCYGVAALWICAHERLAMLPGINTDVTHAGVEYHVQTEDLGTKNPIILTLVYRDGAVVFRETLDYGQTLVAEPSASLLRALMDGQHRRVLRHVSDGELDARADGPEAPPAAAPPKTIEELIEEYLRSRRRHSADPAPHREP